MVERKRIEAIIKAERLESVLTALEANKIDATFYDSKGMGKGEKYTISYGKGVGSSKMLYSERKTIVTVVEDSKVNDVVGIIKKLAGTGTSGAGVIFVSPVDDAIII